MENQNVKRGRGRPKIFTAEELKNKKTAYMLNREWYCDICKSGINYSLVGKHSHLKTKKTHSLCKNAKLIIISVQRIHRLDQLNSCPYLKATYLRRKIIIYHHPN